MRYEIEKEITIENGDLARVNYTLHRSKPGIGHDNLIVLYTGDQKGLIEFLVGETEKAGKDFVALELSSPYINRAGVDENGVGYSRRNLKHDELVEITLEAIGKKKRGVEVPVTAKK